MKIKENKERHIREDRADNMYEILSKLPEIHGGIIRQDISPDFTLAHLSSDERDYIKETYENAGFAKAIILSLALKKSGFKWDNEIKDWVRDDDNTPTRYSLSNEESTKIKNIAAEVYRDLMRRAEILAVLKRNTQENWLGNSLAGTMKVDEYGRDITYGKDEGIIERAKGKLEDKEKGKP